MAKTFTLSDESLNSYGYRVLTSGIDLKNFKKNPVLLFNHERMSWGSDVYNGPVGRWDNIRVEDGKLIGDAVIDDQDPKGKILANKIEKDFIRAASIGFKIIEMSEDKKHLLPGQTRPTITKCELVEVSVVDVPANKNALALYDKDGKRINLEDEGALERLNAFLPPINSDLNPSTNMKKLSLKAGWTALLSFFNQSVEEGKESVEHELTDEQLEEMNSKLASLDTITQERDQLKTQLSEAKTAKETAESSLSEYNSAVKDALKAAELDEKLTGKEAIDALLGQLQEYAEAPGATSSKPTTDKDTEEESSELSEADKINAKLARDAGAGFKGYH